MQDIINSILNLIAPKTPPGSAIFIILVAISTSVFSTLISRRFIDLKKLKLYTKKTKEYRKLQTKALRSQDPVLKKKLENQSSTNKRMQSELAKMRFKPLLYTMLPMIIIFFALSSYYNPNTTEPDTLVGNIPFSLPETLLFFKVGINCQDEKFIINQEFNTLDLTAIKNEIAKNNEQNSENRILASSTVICLKNPDMVYIPTYIGWYIFVNVIINGLITKVSGLTPE